MKEIERTSSGEANQEGQQDQNRSQEEQRLIRDQPIELSAQEPKEAEMTPPASSKDITTFQKLILDLVEKRSKKGEQSEEFKDLKMDLKKLASQNIFKKKVFSVDGKTGNDRFVAYGADLRTVVTAGSGKGISVLEREKGHLGKDGFRLKQMIYWDGEGPGEDIGEKNDDLENSFESSLSLSIELNIQPVDKVLCLDISKDSLMIVAGFKLSRLEIWTRNNRDGEFRSSQTIPHENVVSSVVLSADKLTLITGMSTGQDTAAKISVFRREYEIENFREFQVINHHQKGVQQLALSPDSETLISVGNSQGGKLAAWRLDRVTNEYRLSQNLESSIHTLISSLIISADKKKACFNSSKDVFSWDIERNQVKKLDLSDQSALGSIKNVAMTPDFKTLYLISPQDIEVLCLRGDEEKQKYRRAQKMLGSKGVEYSVMVSREGNRVLVFGNNGEQILWEKPPQLKQRLENQASYTLEGHLDRIKKLEVSQDQRTILSLSENGSLLFIRGMIFRTNSIRNRSCRAISSAGSLEDRSA